MKIKIRSDVFDIVHRIREIDEGYYIVYNTNLKKFELHNSKNVNSYCMTIPYAKLDVRTIDLIHKTSTRHFDKIIEEIEVNNRKIQEKEMERTKERNEYKMREILKYSNSSNKSVEAFKNTWI